MNTHYLTRIHVNKHHVMHNKKGGDPKPEFSIKCNGQTFPAYSVRVQGDVISRSATIDDVNPLSCGATLWFETTDPVYADGILINQRPTQKAA